MKLRELFLIEMPPDQAEDIEFDIKRSFYKLGITINFTKHFNSRLTSDHEKTDAHSREEISPEELISVFKKLENKHKDLFKEAAEFNDEVKRGLFEGVIREELSNINVPFALSFNKTSGKFVLVCKTILKKIASFVNRPTDHIISI